MAKRPHDTENTDRPPKRAKPDHAPAQPAEEIHFARQLSELLVFRQDGLNQLRHGIASFKLFLESILYHHEVDNRGRQLSILREYLDTVKPADPKDTDRPCLAQLWQAWSFANQNNNDYLASSLCAIFALLLKTLSSLLDLREYGNLLCRTILQHQHLRLVKRCLDAPKHKDFLISPSLRLLTELTCFDGGVFARDVYKRSELTFDAHVLPRHLGLFKSDQSEEDERRRPAIRTLTVRYILAHLNFLPEGGKINILKQRPLCSALFSHLMEDPSDLVLEILRSSEQHVFKDKELPRSAKSALLTKTHLDKVTEIATRSESPEAVTEAAFAWLRAVITIPSYGVLRASAWYPPGTSSIDSLLDGGSDMIDLGLDSLEFYDRPGEVHIRNNTLLAWLKDLRPHSDLRERQLALACFEAAPELVHAYFAAKSMQMDPKLTNTWIGYASFIYEVVQLPLPRDCGRDEDLEVADAPPQTTIVLDSVLPSTLTEKVLTRCIHQSSELIRFFAVRLMILSFQKAVKLITEMKLASSSSPRPDLWDEAAERVLERFMEQCPRIRDVINYFRQLPDDEEHALQREAATRLLRLYYQLGPSHALEESFDVSTSLVSALSRKRDVGEADDGVRSLELEHLLTIAKESTGMRWFHKQGGLQFSPFVTLLRLHAKDHQNRQIRQLIAGVLSVEGILGNSAGLEEVSSLDALVASLDSADEAVWTFVDECLSRVSRQPVKYLDQLDALAGSTGSTMASVPPLYAVVLEQAKHVNEHGQSPDREAILDWTSRFVALLNDSREDDLVSRAAGVRIGDLSEPTRVQRDEMKAQLRLVQQEDAASKPPQAGVHSLIANGHDVLPFTSPPAESDDHPELIRWQHKDLDIVIEEGDADALILCLCSHQSNIRRQALQQLRKLLQSLPTSDLEGKEQLYILFGELIETFEQSYEDEDLPLPYLAGTFATHSLKVLGDPTHFMYPKINTYLIKDPEWRVSKLPGYWLDNTVLAEPDEDDAYWKEVQWVLNWLVDGLRTGHDLDLLRRANVFERVMALWSSPAASEKLVKLRVLELVYRAALVDATTLVTRTGVLAWLEMNVAGDEGLRSALKSHILKRADPERLREWAGVELAV